LGQWSPLFTPWSALLAAVVVSFPLLLLPLMSAFASMPRWYREDAILLGLTPGQQLWHVGLPLCWRALIVGAALATARALGEFGATLMIAGNIPGHTQTLPLAIYSAAATGDMHEATRQVALLLALALGLVVAAGLMRPRARAAEGP